MHAHTTFCFSIRLKINLIKFDCILATKKTMTTDCTKREIKEKK